jgi:hypothetical protein
MPTPTPERSRRLDKSLAFAYLVFGCAALAASLACRASSKPPAVTPAPVGRQYHDVSVADLLEHPAWFDGDWVRVRGFARMEFEGTSLWVEPPAAWGTGKMGCVWLSLGWPLPAAALRLSGLPVIVEARFDASGRGHMGLFAGGLRDVRAIWRRGDEDHAYVTNYETRSDALEQLQFKTGWVLLAWRTAGRLEAADGSSAAVCLPSVGDRIRLSSPRRIYIAGASSTGEARRMEAPQRDLAPEDETRFWIAAGTLVRVEEIRDYGDPGTVWARLSVAQSH